MKRFATIWLVLMVGLSAAVLIATSTQGDSIGTDSTGAWKTLIRTNIIFRGTTPEVVAVVVTNRISMEKYEQERFQRQKVAEEEHLWREKLTLVHDGIRRDEVERSLHLVPVNRLEVGPAALTGACPYLVQYRLDDHWTVGIRYDGSESTNKVCNASNMTFLRFVADIDWSRY